MKKQIKYTFKTKAEATDFAKKMYKNCVVVKEVGEKGGKYYVIIED